MPPRGSSTTSGRARSPAPSSRARRRTTRASTPVCRPGRSATRGSRRSGRQRRPRRRSTCSTCRIRAGPARTRSPRRSISSTPRRRATTPRAPRPAATPRRVVDLTILAGVLGHPVAHSRSPDMMNAAFAELGLDWHYVKLPVPPDLFGEIVPALAASGFHGANVTIPHKPAAHALADELTDAAAAIGAVNTLAFEDGRIAGDNTDAPGLIDALDTDLDGATVLILGAGGTARAAVWALREAGADVAVWNRTPARAARLAQEFGVRHASELEPARVLVNVTSLGLHGEDLPSELGLDGVLEPEVVADVVYGSGPTALCRWGEARGARVVDGLEMLLRQGARSFERWTGCQAPLDAMRRALRR